MLKLLIHSGDKQPVMREYTQGHVELYIKHQNLILVNNQNKIK